MNAHTHLLSQGWLGPGHALQPSRPDGLKKHLLVSQKADTHGIGKKKHDAHADQWWLRAFDHTLKDINIGTTDELKKPEAVIAAKRTVGPRIESMRMGKWFRNGGLYAGFVRGEGMKGTLRERDIKLASGVKSVENENANEKRKRKEDHRSLTKDERTGKKRKSAKSKIVQCERLDLPESSRAREDHRENAASAGLDFKPDGKEDPLLGLVKGGTKETKEERHQRKRDKKIRNAQVLQLATRQPTPPKLRRKSTHESRHKSSKRQREEG